MKNRMDLGGKLWLLFLIPPYVNNKPYDTYYRYNDKAIPESFIGFTKKCD